MKYKRLLYSSMVWFASGVLFAKSDPHMLNNKYSLLNHFCQNIEQFFNSYKRPFTVLCVGSRANKIGLRMAQKFQNATFFLVNGAENNLMACHYVGFDNVICIANRLSSEQLKKVSECEHFDMTLVLNIDEGAEQKLTDSLFEMGDYLVVAERMHNKKFSKNIPFFAQEELAFNKDFYAVLYTTNKCYLIRKNFDHPYKAMPRKYFIESTFTKKMLHKRRNGEVLVSAWLPGINLKTFSSLRGGYPDRATVIKNVMKCKKLFHEDYAVHNMVIQGKRVALIDFSPTSSTDKKTAKTKFKTICLRLENTIMETCNPYQI